MSGDDACRMVGWVLALLLAVASPGFAFAQQQGEKKSPKIAMCVPLAVPPESTTKVILRGWNLTGETEVRLPGGKGSAKVLSRGPAPNPNMNKQDPKRIGDTQIEIELTVPQFDAGEKLLLEVVGKEGTSPAHELLVGGAYPVVEEKENNEAFRTAHLVELPQIVDGRAQGERDVDVFAIEGRAGETIVAEVFAARHGSGYDPVLTLYDASSVLLAAVDDGTTGAAGDSGSIDGVNTTDARLQVVLPVDGRYYLCLQDAHDQGGPAHPYRLIVRRQ